MPLTLPLLRPFFRLCSPEAVGTATLVLSILVGPLPASAAPYQVRDINRAATAPTLPLNVFMHFLDSADSVSFLSLDTEAEGLELWRTDGTAAGTEMVRDIYPGPHGSFPGPAIVYKGILYFEAEDAEDTCLWRSDGTAMGTCPVLRTAVLPRAFTIAGGTLFFTAFYTPENAPARNTLWKSDGTVEGTHPVNTDLELPFDSIPRPLVAVGNQIYFAAHQTGNPASGLWKSDGTFAGTVPVTSGGNPVPASSLLFESASLLYFTTSLNNQYTFWRSDGTDSGTTAVKQLAVYPDPGTGQVVTLNGIMYFAGWDGTGGLELWRSDGTAAGTSMVKDIYPGSTGSAPWDLTVWNGQLYFSASESPFLRRLWKSDGTPEGTHVIVGPEFSSSNTGSLTVLGNTLFAVSNLTSSFNLWKSDGTDAGTTLARDLFPSTTIGNIFLQGITSTTLYLTADDPALGRMLWKTNGTPEGTALLRNITPGTGGNRSSTPGRLTDLGGTLYFAAQDEFSGRELWKSDATDSGTTLARDLNPGSNGFFRSPGSNITEGPSLAANGFLYLFGHDGTGGSDLVRSNGSAAGTTLLRDFGPLYTVTGDPAAFTLSGGQIFFPAHTDQEGVELWKTDGTPSGTQIVKDLAPGYSSGPGGSGGNSSNPQELTDIDGQLYFTAGGYSLWTTDGTSSGTRDFAWPGSSTTLRTGSLTRLGSSLLVVSNAGNLGYELWRVDPGTSTPVLVKDVRPGSSSSFLGPNGINGEKDKLAAANGTGWFAAHDGVSDGLWKTDGTAAGTILIKAFPAGKISRRTDFLVAGPYLYFGADDGVHGFELWRSDGTQAGTRMVTDLAPGPASSFPEKLLQPVPGGPVVFLANDGPHGRELWKTVGNASSTTLLTDIAPGPRSSNIGTPVVSGSHLFFPAGQTDTPGAPGIELWALPLGDITAAAVSGNDWGLYE